MADACRLGCIKLAPLAFPVHLQPQQDTTWTRFFSIQLAGIMTDAHSMRRPCFPIWLQHSDMLVYIYIYIYIYI